MQATLAGMPEPTSTTSSVTCRPVVSRWAPAGLTELAQPFPCAPLLPHGQGVVTEGSRPSPGQKLVPATCLYTIQPSGWLKAVLEPKPAITVPSPLIATGVPRSE